MKTKIVGFSISSIAAVALGGLGLVLICGLDFVYWRTGVLDEGAPKGTADYIARAVFIFASCCLSLWGLANGRITKFGLSDRQKNTFELISIAVALAISAFFVGLFLYDPPMFSALSLEDQSVEWVSTLLLFGCSFFTLYSFFIIRTEPGSSALIKISLLFMSLVFFVMAMEEISWFQRVLNIETPDGFSDNRQAEINFHNFATNQFENLYYFGGFVFLVLLPFLRFLFPIVNKINYFEIFIARPYICILGAIPTAYNYDMWNIIYSQVAIYGSIIILSMLFVCSTKLMTRIIIAITIVSTVVSQIFFIMYGENFDRIWEVTEYKELLIPLGLFVYAFDLSRRFKLGKELNG